MSSAVVFYCPNGPIMSVRLASRTASASVIPVLLDLSTSVANSL